MIPKLLFAVALFSILNAQAQETYSLEEVRRDFQLIRNEEDIERLLARRVDSDGPDALAIEAYKAAGTCMMAEYVTSPFKKLKYFNKGKQSLEGMIKKGKSSENVYCRLLIQLKIPRFLNYHDDIEEDIEFLEADLPQAKIDPEYKQTMIRNLVTLADEEELKQSLLGIDLAGDKEKS